MNIYIVSLFHRATIKTTVVEAQITLLKLNKTRMWANAQRDGRPAEYRWRPLFNAAVWLCSNAAKTRNPLKFVGVPQTPESISAVSGPKFTVLTGRVEEVLLFNIFLFDCRYVPRYVP